MKNLKSIIIMLSVVTIGCICIHLQAAEPIPPDLLPVLARTMSADAPAEYQMTPIDNTYRAENPNQGFVSHFTPDSVLLLSSGEDSGWSMTLTGIGYDIIHPVPPATLSAEGIRLEYRRGANITEWYLNSPTGLEQGITLQSPPPGRERHVPLQITFALDGLTQFDEQKIAFLSIDGQVALSYSGLMAWDADGKVLPTRLILEGTTLYWTVQDQGARYPLTIDPWIQQTKLTNGERSNNFGYSVALSGDTALIGGQGTSMGCATVQGAVYVFVNNGLAWGLQATLVPDDEIVNDDFGKRVAFNDETALISADDVVYVFVRNGTTWTQQAVLKDDDGVGGDHFGVSVSVRGDTAVVGADDAIVDGHNFQGTAYVFVRAGTIWNRQAKLVANDGAVSDHFGVSVATTGDTVIVGSNYARINSNEDQGAAYVFVRMGTAWNQQAKLTADDGAEFDYFGDSVALSGETAVVGASWADINGKRNQGTAYVFVRTGTTWSQQTKLTADDGAADDEFGRCVALSGDTALIGASWANIDGKNNQGTGYVFVRTGTTWSQQAKLIADDGAEADFFGANVALSGDIALIGVHKADVYGNFDQGAAYILARSASGWSQYQKLTTGDGKQGDFFGYSVALSGDTAVIGAPNANADGSLAHGAVYVFVRKSSFWILQAKLIASDGYMDDDFGASVALSDNTIVVGAPYADVGGTRDQGAAYVFIRNGAIWSQQTKLIADDGLAYDYFGVSVAIDDDMVVVGAPEVAIGGQPARGAVYVFVRDGSLWGQPTRLTANDGLKEGYFGGSVAIDDAFLVIGSKWADVNAGDNQGAVYVFMQNGTIWSQQTKLIAGDGTISAHFGCSVAMNQNVVVIGASGAKVNEHYDQGAAYVFIHNGGNWTRESKLTATDGEAGDAFGDSVALSGATAVIGAPNAHINGNADQGASYAFAREGVLWNQQTKLLAHDGAAYDYFGYSVVIDGATALIGAYLADIDVMNAQGAAYEFTGVVQPSNSFLLWTK